MQFLWKTKTKIQCKQCKKKFKVIKEGKLPNRCPKCGRFTSFSYLVDVEKKPVPAKKPFFRFKCYSCYYEFTTDEPPTECPRCRERNLWKCVSPHMYEPFNRSENPFRDDMGWKSVSVFDFLRGNRI